MSKILYISYDGMLEPLGQSQVLGYLLRLSEGRRIFLISFEKTKDWQDAESRDRIEKMIADAGITWVALRYHKAPSVCAKAWDILCGVVCGLKLTRRHRIDVVHARSYVAGVMAMVLKSITGVRFLFDMRGFWVDERVDGGLWPNKGLLYRVGKWFERRLLGSADHVISLTHAAVREMRSWDHLKHRSLGFTVIPTCADLERFVPVAESGAGQGFTLGYVGSAGTWYLFDQVVECYLQLLMVKPEARFLIVNREDHSYIRERLACHGVDLTQIQLIGAQHHEVPSLIGRMNAAVFFYKPSYSRLACAPTKLGEFLGCGVPCLCNAGVGDMGQILDIEKVGVTLETLGEPAFREGLTRLLELVADSGVRDRCVAAARKHFSLDEGVTRYAAVYAKLLSENKS